MRRPTVALTLSIGIGLVLVACASPAGSPGVSAGSQPSERAVQSQAAGQSQAASQAGSVGEAPALADGPWTGGQGKTTVSGAVSQTTDAPITTSVSKTEQAKTLLAYNTDDTFVTININFIGVPFSTNITAPHWSATGRECQVTYARADDTGIDATFSCVVDEFIYMGTGTAPTGKITIEGSFTATR